MTDHQTPAGSVDDAPPSTWRRRSLLGAVGAIGAAVAAPVPGAAGAAAAGTGPASAAAGSTSRTRVPPDTRPGGAYDRYLAQLAAAGTFSGVVLLSHRGRTVLSRSYGLADRERGIPHHE